jgi:hypothetical protein
MLKRRKIDAIATGKDFNSIHSWNKSSGSWRIRI